jgi:riboflavin biosynthesis pyrimidine reductase
MDEESRAVAEIERRARTLYGSAATRDVAGVLHVLSAVETSDGRLHVIRIGPNAPKSSTDFFVLNFWRAHADAIVTTAAIVRAEPALSHELQGPQATELAAYRKQRLKKPETILCAILTRTGDLPLEHQLWNDRVEYRVLTAPERATDLQSHVGSRATVFGVPDLGAASAVAWLRAQGAKHILIEAGPSTANALYETTPGVDHLLLSRFEGSFVPAAVGGELVESPRLFAGLSRVASSERTEESGPWRFERWDKTSTPRSGALSRGDQERAEPAASTNDSE